MKHSPMRPQGAWTAEETEHHQRNTVAVQWSAPKETDIHSLLSSEIKTVVLKQFSELKGNTERQLNGVMKTDVENEKFEHRSIIKKNKQTLDRDNTMNDMQNTVETINHKCDQAEKKNLWRKDRSLSEIIIIEVIQSEETREKILKKEWIMGYHQEKQSKQCWSPRRTAGKLI